MRIEYGTDLGTVHPWGSPVPPGPYTVELVSHEVEEGKSGPLDRIGFKVWLPDAYTGSHLFSRFPRSGRGLGKIVALLKAAGLDVTGRKGFDTEELLGNILEVVVRADGRWNDVVAFRPASEEARRMVVVLQEEAKREAEEVPF